MKNDKIIQTIKKILELSNNNPSEEEAKAAALKAQELLAKYHLSMADIETEDDIDNIVEVSVDVPSKKWKYTLAQIVADNFRCKHFYYGKMRVVFYGHETDANIAAETFKYLFKLGNIYAGREVDKVFARTGTSAGVYNSFCIGFCDGLKEAFDKQCTALMIVVPKEVHDAYAERTKDSSTMKVSGIKTVANQECMNAYNEGVVKGKEAVNSKQLEG